MTYDYFSLIHFERNAHKKGCMQKMNIIDLFVDFLMLILFAVVGFGIYYATNTTAWDATTKSIWGFIPLVFIAIGIVALVIKVKSIGH